MTRLGLLSEKRKRRHRPKETLQGSETWDQKKISASAPGFLGRTSYCDVFLETDNDLPTGYISHFKTTDPGPIDAQRIRLGAQILMLLKNQDLYREIVEERYKIWRGWTFGYPMTNVIFNSVEEMWKDAKQKIKDDSECALALSKSIFKNYTQPIQLSSTTSWEDFASSASHRWETIGLMFAIMGIATRYISHELPMFKRKGSPDPKSLAITATAVGDICLQLCDSTGVMNDYVVLLLLHHTSLLTTIYGESDYRPWRKLGELSTAVFALGLHQESSNLPFFIREMRKRVLVAAYAMDKTLATFLGRPPLISCRYCDIEFPLDLSCEEIAAPPEVRNAAIAKLTPDGWNSEGSLVKGSWARVYFLTSILREKILELSLSRQSDNLAEQVENLSQESHKTYQELPIWLHWTPNIGYPTPSALQDNILFDLYLDFLYNDFLLYRILAKRTQTQPDAIISASCKILNASLSMLTKIAKLKAPGWDIGWHLCYAGLPAAGVLCAELLRRSRSMLPDTDIFQRSEIIQSLSVFASHLGTMIQPDEGNYRIAEQGRRAIRHVLDQVLSVDSLSAIPATSDEELDIHEQISFEESLLNNVDIEDRGPFLDWLNGTAEQCHEPWLTWMNFS
ncbi:Transcription factor [Penicillium lagena]|uniref:Transcription factor n=1 Tax=Penicillium lagena TaxID=94218 RepID=UPI0025413844|nr:Transcription factor [Penicillium lagena]KAJ5618987.1 Transcription factor [Penicillium lagena]